MNRPLRLTECSHRITCANVDNLRNIRCVLRGWMCVFHGMFATHYRNPSAMFWQSVRSRRGRFIAPAYTYTPTKWQTDMCVRWNEYTYLMMWKHVIGLRKYTFLIMQGYGHDESVPYAWRNVRNQFRGCSQPFHGMFATHFVGGRNHFTECS